MRFFCLYSSIMFSFLYPLIMDADCILPESYSAIKAKVISCRTAEEFFQEKLQTELKSTPDLLSTPHFKVDWNSILNNPPLRIGVVLNLKVLEIRTFTFDCAKFISQEVSDPYIWQDSWKKPESLDPSGMYFWRGGKCSEHKTDEPFFIYFLCCDAYPSASISCAFDIGEVESKEEIIERCEKQYGSRLLNDAGEQVVPADASCASSVAHFAIR